MYKLFLNKRGSIPITLFVILVFVLFIVALASFMNSDRKLTGSFEGIKMVRDLSSQAEVDYFHEIFLDEKGISGDVRLFRAIEYSKKNKVVNKNCFCEDVCKNYAQFILSAAEESDVDPFLILSLMMQESNCLSTIFRENAMGVMQVSLSSCGKYGLSEDKTICQEQLKNIIPLNIQAGTKILREGYDLYKDGKFFDGCSHLGITYYGWDAALRNYLGWECFKDTIDGNEIPSMDNYVSEINERTELLKRVVSYSEKVLKDKFYFSVSYESPQQI
jgi:hypothetical protein